MANKTKLTPKRKSRLRELAEIDASLPEMAYVVGVSKQTIYNWKENDKEFFDELDRLRAKPLLKVRETIVEKATESYANAMDYAKRKARTEFGDNSNVQITAPKPLLEMLHLEAKPVEVKEIPNTTETAKNKDKYEQSAD